MRTATRPPASDAPFLSVVIPTYNRAEQLDRQLRWLHDELTGLGVTWEIRIHDNCSSDHTSAVALRWQEIFGSDVLTVVHNEQNIGGVPNLAAALSGARGAWVWSIGDDDEIHDGTCRSVVETLQAHPDLALLYLNFRGVDVSGRVTTEHYFHPEVTGRFEDGRSAFAHHALRDLGSVIFLTATVYRTELVQEAMLAWGDDGRNWALVAYWTGYVTARGPILITPEVRIDCLIGVSHWQHERGAWVRAVYLDVPKVAGGLFEQGYPRDFCLKVGYPVRWTRVPWYVLVALRSCPECFTALPRLRAIRLGGARPQHARRPLASGWLTGAGGGLPHRTRT